MDSEYLYHHGVKGMKWGVRRYQNYDGSYTKRGLERYNKAQADYDSAKETAAKSKAAYKSGTGSRQKYRADKTAVRASREKLAFARSKLKNDYMADEGKKLYQRGKTITDNSRKLMVSQAAISVGANVTSQLIQSKFGNTKAAHISASTIAVGGTTVNTLLAMKGASERKKLRAYYAH